KLEDVAHKHSDKTLKKKVREDDDDDDGKPNKKKAKAKDSKGRKQRPEDLLKEAVIDDEDAKKPRLKSAAPVVKIENKHVFQKPTEKIIHDVELPETITVGELAQRMSIKAPVVIK